MKTVAQVAKELQVTPQAIYNRINKTFKTELKQHVKKDNGGKTVISEAGVELIKRSFEQVLNEFETGFKQVETDIAEHLRQENEYLRKQLAYKDEQIAKKDEQIQEQLREATRLHQNTQEILLRLNSTPLLEGKQEQEAPAAKRGFFDRLFKG